MSVRSRPASLSSRLVAVGVDVVVVTHGGGADLPDAIAGARAQGDAINRIVVIDNASPDGTADVASGLAGVEVRRLPENLGYAAAMNIGLAMTDAPYVLALNADARLGEGYVRALVAALEADPTAAAATGTLVLPEGVVDSSGLTLTTAYVAFERDRGTPPADVSTEPPFGVSGAASLWRRSALVEVGSAPWWEWLFVYWDDVELSWRLRRRGWHMLSVPSARAEHRRGSDFAPSRFVEAAALRNRLATIARHRGARGLLRPGALAVTAATMARLLVRHPGALLDAHPLAAIRAGRRASVGDAGQLPAASLQKHPWGPWIAQQFSRGRRGLGAVPRTGR